jgi:hypothetical protein
VQRLTKEQLSRKRAKDRIAQQIIRQRTKEKIEELEGEVERLREENQQLCSKNRLLKAQIAHEEPSTSHMLPPQQNQSSLLMENSSCRPVPELGGISSVISPTPLPADQICSHHPAWIDDQKYHAMQNSATVCYTGTTEASIIADPSINVWLDWHIATNEQRKDQSLIGGKLHRD